MKLVKIGHYEGDHIYSLSTFRYYRNLKKTYKNKDLDKIKFMSLLLFSRVMGFLKSLQDAQKNY